MRKKIFANSMKRSFIGRRKTLYDLSIIVKSRAAYRISNESPEKINYFYRFSRSN